MQNDDTYNGFEMICMLQNHDERQAISAKVRGLGCTKSTGRDAATCLRSISTGFAQRYPVARSSSGSC